jgi:hypothetical protein
MEVPVSNLGKNTNAFLKKFSFKGMPEEILGAVYNSNPQLSDPTVDMAL